MASLKEIKDRINSVNGTMKGNLLPYQRQMHHILADLLSDEASAGDEYIASRPLKKVAVVAFASNSSLCGAFNSNAVRHFSETVEKYRKAGLGNKDIMVFAVGRKMEDAVRKMGFVPEGTFTHLADKPSYEEAAKLAETLSGLFLNKEADKVELVYTHFKSASTQVPVTETYLPVSLESSLYKNEEHHGISDFIIEPDPDTVLRDLLPKVLLLKIYSVVLDANVAEHAARMMAMQLATDNGNELLAEIRLQYNKQRQQEITNELQDIIGGTLA